MGCRGVYFALTEDDVKKLMGADNDAHVKEVIQEDIEQRWDKDWLQETDKAWDAMHRCLTDGTLTCEGKSILEKCVLGGKQLHQGGEYIVSFLTPGEVKDVSEALKPISQDWFRKKCFSLKKKFLWFDMTDYEGPMGEDDYGYTWSYFEETRKFFQKASEAGRAVVFTVDQ
jgi:hypothetical protein